MGSLGKLLNVDLFDDILLWQPKFFPTETQILAFSECHLVNKQISFFFYHNKQDEWGWEYGIQSALAFSGSTTLWCENDGCWNVCSFEMEVLYHSNGQTEVKYIINKKNQLKFWNTCFSFPGPDFERPVWHGQEFICSQKQIRQCNWFMCVSSGILSGSYREGG